MTARRNEMLVVFWLLRAENRSSLCPESPQLSQIINDTNFYLKTFKTLNFSESAEDVKYWGLGPRGDWTPLAPYYEKLQENHISSLFFASWRRPRYSSNVYNKLIIYSRFHIQISCLLSCEPQLIEAIFLAACFEMTWLGLEVTDVKSLTSPSWRPIINHSSRVHSIEHHIIMRIIQPHSERCSQINNVNWVVVLH